MIYLDHHSTTPCDGRVVEAMMPWWNETFANPHSDHAAGREVADAVNTAKDLIAADLGTTADRLVITSGATESNNLAITGYCLHPRQKKRKLITTAIEHPCVIDPMKNLQGQGFELAFAKVDSAGRVDLDSLAGLLDDDTALVSVGWANHEIGTIQDVGQIGKMTQSVGAAFHCDATQAIGRVVVDVSLAGVDLLTGSAHKLYGPRGTGLLVVGGGNRRTRLSPMILGGGQQRSLRSGTLNVPGLMGLQAAVRIAITEMESESHRVASLRNDLWNRLNEAIPGLVLNGPPLASDDRLAGNLNFQCPDVEGETWMAAVADVAFSTGSACSSVDPEPSEVLLATGLTESQARRSIRIGVGRGNDARQIATAADAMIAGYRRLTGASA